VDATYVCLEVLRLLKCDEFFTEARIQQCRSFLSSCLVKGAAFAIGRDTNFSSIYATNCAVGIVKSLEGIPCGNHLVDYGAAKETMSSDTVEGIVRFLRSCREENRTLLVDNGQPAAEPDLNTTYTAHRILWNLGRADLFYTEMVERERLQAFILEGFYRTDFMGFPYDGSSAKGCMCAARFALRLLSTCGDLSTLVPAEARTKILRFLEAFRNKESGGFFAVAGDTPSLYATYFALDICSILQVELKDKERALDFVRSCKKGKAFAFAEGLTPNPFASRYAVQVLSLLGQKGMDLVRTYRQDLTDFVTGDLYERDQGCFWGFPPRRT
jgi:hypothetical protein